MPLVRLFRVCFLVQADNVQGAIVQAERYLNTGSRVVDFNVEGIRDGHGSHHPIPAPVIEEDS